MPPCARQPFHPRRTAPRCAQAAAHSTRGTLHPLRGMLYPASICFPVRCIFQRTRRGLSPANISATLWRSLCAAHRLKQRFCPAKGACPPRCRRERAAPLSVRTAHIRPAPEVLSSAAPPPQGSAQAPALLLSRPCAGFPSALRIVFPQQPPPRHTARRVCICCPHPAVAAAPAPN